MRPVEKTASKPETAIPDRNDTGCISGLVVQVNPDRIEQVSNTLNSFQGVEVHAADPVGKLVITIEEQPGQKTMVDDITRINLVAGVISSTLVYAHHGA